jgi:hypothetical protein
LSEICPMDNLWTQDFSSKDETIGRMVCTNGFTDFSKAIRHTLYKKKLVLSYGQSHGQSFGKS